MLRASIFLAGLLAVACAEPAISRSEPVVYGTDDRLDVYEHPSERFQQIARNSIAAQISMDHLDISDAADVQVVAETLMEDDNLCPGERFATQPTGARCSATLIARDMLLTAGHCVEDLAECQRYVYAFNYYYEAPDTLATMTTDDLYRCESIVSQVDSGGLDYAVIRLDRPVPPPHEPVSVVPGDEALARSAPVTVIGFGRGLPMKIDSGGEVLLPRADTLDFFEASTDTFNSNSGSSVFNAAGEVVGILVRGKSDYVLSGGCNRVNVLPMSGEDGAGDAENITYVARAIEGVCEGEVPSELCGDTTGSCRACAVDADCPAEALCLQNALNEHVSHCAAPCSADADCSAGHACADGRCHPTTGLLCAAGSVWERDVCGRRVTVRAECEPAEVCLDAACAPAQPGNACADAETVDAVTQVISGRLEAGAFGNSAVGSCGGEGRDRVYHFRLERRELFLAAVDGFDTVLHLRSTCEDPMSELACNDDGRRGSGSAFSQMLEAGDYYLVLDSFSREQMGAFTLRLQFGASAGTDAGLPDGGSGPAAGSGCSVSSGRRAPLSLPAIFMFALAASSRRRR